MPHIRWIGAGLILSLANAPTLSLAAPKPVLIEAAYQDPEPPTLVRPSSATACAVHIVEIGDMRRSPELVGMLDRKPVYAPNDRAAWLHSIVAGLGARGFALNFDDAGTERPDVINAHITLQSLSVSNTLTNLNSTAVFRLQANNDKGRSVDDLYRGTVAGMNWANGGGEIKNKIDTAFSHALDAMAAGLAGLCKT